MSVRENPHIDADAQFEILELRGGIVFGFDSEDGEPFACGFAFDRDLFDRRTVGNLSVKPNWNIADLAQPQQGAAARILELEAGLIVGERTAVPRWFPLVHPRYL